MPDASDPRTVVCFGDSLTWGFDPRGGVMFQRYGFAERWTRRLGAELGPGYHVVEEGLSGRTTVFDDPVLGGMSGLVDLPNVLKSHMPVDLLVIMLGSNDVKARFAVNADEIARCLSRLLDHASKSNCGPDMGAPEILVVIPPTLGDLDGTWLESLFDGETSRAKSRRLGETYPVVATQFGAHCFDPAKAVGSGTIDGVHMDPDMLEPFAVALASVIDDLFEHGTSI